MMPWEERTCNGASEYFVFVMAKIDAQRNGWSRHAVAIQNVAFCQQKTNWMERKDAKIEHNLQGPWALEESKYVPKDQDAWDAMMIKVATEQ